MCAGRPSRGFSLALALRLRDSDGHYQQFDVVACNRLHDPAVCGHVLNMRDATERHRLERELRELATQREHDAMHDPLTGLANRRRLFAVLEQGLVTARAERTVLGMLLIDLDHFKELNDTLGHQAGDQLLREIGPRLHAAADEAQLVARLGGDEFAVLLRPGVGAAEAVVVAERIRAAIEKPSRVQGLTLLVQASVGIAIHPEHADSVETLMQRADVAMYSAKARGVGHEIYSSSRDAHSKERLALLGELPDAIAGGQLVVHYQPKVDLASGEITGAEALVRWNHPRRGLLSPAEFISLAEQTGLMRPLTLHVLDRALADCRRWDEEGLELGVAVNLAAPNLLDLALPRDVAVLLQRRGVEPSRLHLEITETIVAADPVRVAEILAELRKLGVILSLDDFGTGSSSLGYLRRLPVQELKIDKSFILGMADDEQAAAIVRTTVDLAHTLGLHAVAEGIETEPVRDRLQACGCDHGQGFLLGRPMPADQLAALARTQRRQSSRLAQARLDGPGLRAAGVVEVALHGRRRAPQPVGDLRDRQALALAQMPGDRHRAAALLDTLLQAGHARTVAHAHDTCRTPWTDTVLPPRDGVEHQLVRLDVRCCIHAIAKVARRLPHCR